MIGTRKPCLGCGHRFRQVLLAEEDFPNCRKANRKSGRPLNEDVLLFNQRGSGRSLQQAAKSFPAERTCFHNHPRLPPPATVHCFGTRERMTYPLQVWREDWLSKIDRERFLRVRWLLNPDQPPLENIEIVEHCGRITEIRSLAASDRDVLPVILIPALVNAHTHLEFSSLSKPICPALPFQNWITAVIKSRRGADTEGRRSVRQGLIESQQSGVTAVGEITTTHPISADDVDKGSSVISFREIIGLQQERIPELTCLAKEHLMQFSTADANSSVVGGISPHAPYSVHPDLFASLIELAINRDAIVAMHLAETTDELELLHDGKGAFVEFLKQLNLWDPVTFPGGRSIRDFLEQLARTPRALAIHGNYFSNDDIQFLADQPNVATVYCPRTHAFFGHTSHPIERLMAKRARVVLGTDSRASNPDLSLWKELQFVAARFPNIPIPRLLAMATIDAADALGLPTERHKICAGEALECVMLNADRNERDLHKMICDPATQPTATLIGEIAK